MDSKIEFRTRRVAAALALCVATISCGSKSPRTIENGSYYIVSNCVTPIRQQAVRTANNTLLAPDSYTDFGFPTTIVRLGESSAGIVGAVNRECMQTYGDNAEGTRWVFSCFDGGAYVCSILIQTN